MGRLKNSQSILFISLLLATGTSIGQVPDQSIGDFGGTEATRLSVEVFSVPNSRFMSVAGISSSGVIAGNYEDPSRVSHGFVRDVDGSFTSFDAVPPNAGYFGTQVTSINAEGEIVGYFSFVENGVLLTQGFVLDPGGTITLLNSLQGAKYVIPLWINAAGQIAGVYTDENSFTHLFVLDKNGTLSPFDTPGFNFAVYDARPKITAKGQVFGSYLLSNGLFRGYIHDKQGTLTSFDAPDVASSGGVGCGHCSGTLVSGVNSRGDSVGYYGGADLKIHGFLRKRDGSITTVDPSGSRYTTPKAINARGDIVGVYLDAFSSRARGFLLRADGTEITFDTPDSVQVIATAINDSGNVVGIYIDSNSNFLGFVAKKSR